MGLSAPMKLNDETNNANEHNMAKNPNWPDRDQGRVVRKPVNVNPGLNVN